MTGSLIDVVLHTHTHSLFRDAVDLVSLISLNESMIPPHKVISVLFVCSHFILPRVLAQGRFRARNAELEAEGRHHQQTILSLRNEIDTLR